MRGRASPPVLARIAPATSAGPRALTRRDLAAYGALLERLGTAGVVALAGGPARTAVAVGLAAAAAAAARRAVLVEADLARPSLAGPLGLSAGPGLVEYLRGEARAGDILQPLMLAGPAAAAPVEQLVCIVAGSAAADAEALLGTDAFRHALARLRSAYAPVVAVSPPDHRDGSLLAVSAQADVTVACCTEHEVAGWSGVGGVVVVG